MTTDTKSPVTVILMSGNRSNLAYFFGGAVLGVALGTAVTLSGIAFYRSERALEKPELQQMPQFVFPQQMPHLMPAPEHGAPRLEEDPPLWQKEHKNLGIPPLKVNPESHTKDRSAEAERESVFDPSPFI